MKKLSLSFGLIIAFAFYVVFSNSKSVALNLSPTQTSGTSNQPSPQSQTTGNSNQQPQAQAPVVQSGAYKNGSYMGSVADAYYGNVQVKAIISGGKITDVQFLDYPRDRGTSVRINSYAMPYLTQEAIQAQSANVNVVSGATATSGAFNESLASALAQAIN